MSSPWLLIASYALLLFTPQGAQEFEITWFTIDAGGITFATDGQFELGGTIGQPDAHDSISDGAMELSGGFWISSGGCLGGHMPGDMNCDCIVTPGDITGFVVALTNPAAYPDQFPDCRILNGDINGDGFVTAGDIAGFVELLTGG